MGKRWRRYAVGPYRLGSLFDKQVGRDEAVVRWRDETGKHRRRLGVFSESEGRTALDGFVGNIAAITARQSQTIGDVYAAYVADREKDGKLVQVFRDNWKALEPRFGSMQIGDVTADVCRDYAKTRLDVGRTVVSKARGPRRLDVSVGTVWTELTRLRSAVNWARKRNLIARAPYIWVPTKPAPKQRVLTVEEFLRFLQACDVTPHLRLFVIIAITTGARSEAILGLLWEQVDFDAWTIDFRSRDVINPLTKKVRKGRAIAPMTSEARAALQEAHQGALTSRVVEMGWGARQEDQEGLRGGCEACRLG
jgi:integrase